MTRNRLSDLNNHLFEQLERLNDTDITEQELKVEITRSKAMSDVAKNIIENGKLALEASKFRDARTDIEHEMPRLLE